jgi:hypothetical protein
MNPNHELDHILDQALSEYRDAEPLAGMEDRILRRIAAQQQRPRRRWIFVAVAAAAMVLMALWLGLRERPHQPITATNRPQPTQQLAPNPAELEKPLAQIPHPAGREAEAGWARARSQSPRLTTPDAQSAQREPSLNQFPAPAPLTGEEHALLALARTNPDVLLNLPETSGELSIAPIDIKPLPAETVSEGEQQ